MNEYVIESQGCVRLSGAHDDTPNVRGGVFVACNACKQHFAATVGFVPVRNIVVVFDGLGCLFEQMQVSDVLDSGEDVFRLAGVGGMPARVCAG